MKKIIKRKMYNTETANYVTKAESKLPVTDFGYWEEILYQKVKTGEYFLYGHGGPASKYAEFNSNGNATGGEDIIPLTEDQALNWAEKNISAEEYCEIFGEPEE